MNELIQKILMSSKDPKQLGLTVRGMLVGLIPLATSALSLASGGVVDSGVVSTFVEDLITVVEQGATLISGIMIFLGVARKFWFTVIDIYMSFK